VIHWPWQLPLLTKPPVLAWCRGSQEQALDVRKQYISPLGDHITLLNIFNAYNQVRIFVKPAQNSFPGLGFQGRWTLDMDLLCGVHR
jgi:hypothetical protein